LPRSVDFGRQPFHRRRCGFDSDHSKPYVLMDNLEVLDLARCSRSFLTAATSSGPG
jgi:hypothetical protein